MGSSLSNYISKTALYEDAYPEDAMIQAVKRGDEHDVILLI